MFPGLMRDWLKDPVLDKRLAEAVGAASGADGWANLASVGSSLARLASDFDTHSWESPSPRT